MPNRQDIYRHLVDVVAFLEKELGQAPVVYGSLGVELALQHDYDAHDIDLIVMDEAYDPKKITQSMRRHGYSVVPQTYLAYRKNGIDVEIANWDFWKKAVAFTNDPMVTVMVDQTPMRVLSVPNLKLLYAFLARREGRAIVKRSRDQIKLNDLTQALKNQSKKTATP
ncbi:MAG: hypothetical protein WC399_04370 [Bacilli bacterium]|jgi:hypothetical protein